MKDKVLVVDDSEVARHEVVEMLKSAGYDTVEAESGKRGVEVVKAGGIAMIITDVHMPIMNGIEMCEALHAELGAKMPPALVVSTESSPGMKERGKKVGVKGWVIKPVDPPKLVQVIRTLIDRSRG